METIKCVKHHKYSHVMLLNGFDIDAQTKLHKYIPYQRFKKDVESEKLTFVSPLLWRDPFERRFWNVDYAKKYDGFITPEIACLCLTKLPNTNEEACWNLYKSPTSKMLRVSYDVEALLTQLNNYAEHNGCNIYIGKVEYLKRSEIVALHTGESKYFPKKDFDVSHYLSLMCLKRKSYTFENEIRIFVVGNKILHENMLKVKVNYKSGLLLKVVIAPLEPFDISDPRYDNYDEIQNIEKKVFKKKLKTFIPEYTNILQSTLYKEDKDKVEFV